MKMILAAGTDYSIGEKGVMPWKRIPEDMKLFQRYTQDKIVVMGGKTWLSLPEKHRPLKDRTNVVLSKTLPPSNDYYVIRDIMSLVLFLQNMSGSPTFDDVVIMGGGQLYSKFYPYCHELCLTTIDRHFKDADTHATFLHKVFKEWEAKDQHELPDENYHVHYCIFENLNVLPLSSLLPG